MCAVVRLGVLEERSAKEEVLRRIGVVARGAGAEGGVMLCLEEAFGWFGMDFKGVLG